MKQYRALKRYTILVDVDCVIAPMLEQGWLPKYNRDFDDSLTVNDITSWDLRNFVKPDAKGVIYEYLHDSNLYDNVIPEKDSQIYIARLRELDCRIVYVTTGIFRSKVNWLYRYGFLEGKSRSMDDEKDLVITADKSLVLGHVIIDDKPETILSSRLSLPILYTKPWNMSIEYNTRAYNWKDVYDLFLIWTGIAD